MDAQSPHFDEAPRMARLVETTRLFLKLGSISFGGPAVFMAIIEEEVVRRRRWVSREEFLDYLGMTNLIPGPNVVELAAHIGYRRAGLSGALASGIAFALPAVLLTVLCAWWYVEFGSAPLASSFLSGIKPTVLVVLFAAVWRLGKKAMRTRPLFLIGSTVGIASYAGVDEILALLAGGLLGMSLLRWLDEGKRAKERAVAKSENGQQPPGNRGLPILLPLATTGAITTATATMSLGQVALFFLKIGAVLYGTGFVLVAYLQGGLVDAGHLTHQELMDAVAIGQLTPGPITSTVAFVGYLIGGPSGPLGVGGALVASAAVYTPGFVFIAIVHPLIPWLRRSVWASCFLDAVGAASIGLMAALGILLTRTAVVDWQTGLIAAVAAAASFHPKVTPARLIIAGGIVGAMLSL